MTDTNLSAMQDKLFSNMRYSKKNISKISMLKTLLRIYQHYGFATNAFISLIQKYGGDKYEFSIRETKTFEIIDDVKNLRSEIGIIYLSNYNKSVLQKIIRESNLKFLSLIKAKPHIL